MKTFGTVLTVVLVGALGAWKIQSGESSPQQEGRPDRETLPVNTSILKPVSAIQRDRRLSGTIVAARRSRLAFERSARLKSVLADEGQFVEAGELLAEIDTRQLRKRILQTEAELARQRAVLRELNAGPRKELIAATEAELAAIAADVELQRLTNVRVNRLKARDAISDQEFDEAELAFTSLESRRVSVQQRLKELRAGTRVERVEAQQAVVDGLKAELSGLMIDLTDSQLKAPYAGTIVARIADEGVMLTAQQPVFELLETGVLEARIGVPTNLLNSLDLDGYKILKSGDVEVTGRIRSVLGQVDPNTRTRTAIIDIDADDSGRLADGQLIRMEFQEDMQVDGFEVPVSALAAGSKGLWTMYVVTPVKGSESAREIVSRNVQVMHTTGDRVVVSGAVYEGERFVTKGLHRVVPGQRVSLANDEG